MSQTVRHVSDIASPRLEQKRSQRSVTRVDRCRCRYRCRCCRCCFK